MISPQSYGRFVIAVAGFGGLLYGIDLGIISAALLYLSKTVNLSVAQTSIIVAAVLGGSMISSLIAGVLADWFGRRSMMITSALMFVGSVAIILVSQDFGLLFVGRLLQGMSGGVIAVVIPLYLAECLDPTSRGKGAAIFQLMITIGVVLASLVGWWYTRQAEAAIHVATGNPGLIRAAQDHAWRSMFLSTIYPGGFFLLGTLFLVETPRWLFRQGRSARALAVLRRLSSPEEADRQLREMEAIAAERAGLPARIGDSLLQRKYVVPFTLVCLILACNQATGINSVLGFLVIILKQAGLTPDQATASDVVIKLLHCLVTVAAVALVDSRGRRFLLRLGTGGLILSMLAAAYLFHTFESQRVDERAAVQAAQLGNTVRLPLNAAMLGHGRDSRAMALTVLYSYGNGDKIATAVSSDNNPTLTIVPEGKSVGAPLTIKRASLGPVASSTVGWLTTVCLAFFISFYSVGPGVVVWLILSELMPTRIRSVGIGVALLLNQGTSTVIAAVFLPVVGNHGFYAMFLFWAACTAVYFATATFFLPETKGKTLEEIEYLFERGPQSNVPSTS